MNIKTPKKIRKPVRNESNVSVKTDTPGSEPQKPVRLELIISLGALVMSAFTLIYTIRKDRVDNIDSIKRDSIAAANAEAQRKSYKAYLTVSVNILTSKARQMLGTDRPIQPFLMDTDPLLDVYNSGNAPAEDIAIRTLTLTLNKADKTIHYQGVAYDFAYPEPINVTDGKQIHVPFGTSVIMDQTLDNYIFIEMNYRDKFDVSPNKIHIARKFDPTGMRRQGEDMFTLSTSLITNNEEEIFKDVLINAGFDYDKIKGSIHQQLSKSRNVVQ